MRTRRVFLRGAAVVLSILFMTVMFTPYLAAGDEETDDKVDKYLQQRH